jgi:hypothetical protein
MKKLLIISHLLLFKLSVFAQNQQSNGWYTNPMHYILPELNATYERFIRDDWSLSYSFGYKVPVMKSGNWLSNIGRSTYSPLIVTYANGIYTAIAPAYYYTGKKRDRFPFWQVELFNRFYWFKNHFDKSHGIFGNVDESEGVSSERTNVTGIKLLWGFNDASLDTGVGKTYMGIGFRYKWFYYKSTNNLDFDTNGTPIPMPDTMLNGTRYEFSIHLNTKIGDFIN